MHKILQWNRILSVPFTINVVKCVLTTLKIYYFLCPISFFIFWVEFVREKKSSLSVGGQSDKKECCLWAKRSRTLITVQLTTKILWESDQSPKLMHHIHIHCWTPLLVPPRNLHMEYMARTNSTLPRRSLEILESVHRTRMYVHISHFRRTSD